MGLMPDFRILVLASNPDGGTITSVGNARHLGGSPARPLQLSDGVLQLDRELALIQETIRGSRHRDRVHLECRWAVTPDRFLEALSQFRANVVHFMGHSCAEGILLADEENRPVLLPKDLLVRTMTAVGTGVQLVLLNSCESFEIARSLADRCGCAIGMSEKIPDEAAWTFSRAFYRALADGHSVPVAFEHGRLALAYRRLRDEELPGLFSAVDPATIGLATAEADRAQVPVPADRPVRLSPDELEDLVDAAGACDLLRNRDLLLAGLPAKLRHSLPLASDPLNQVRRDLHALNDMGRVRGLDVPVLAVWLRSAETLAGVRIEADVFARVRERILSHAGGA